MAVTFLRGLVHYRYPDFYDPGFIMDAIPASVSDFPSAILIADGIGLDFLNSIATPTSAPVEWIANGEALLAWLAHTGLITDELAQRINGNALPGELDAVAGQARALREWFRHFVLQHMGRSLEASVVDELRPLNAILTRDECFATVTATTAAPSDQLPGQLVLRQGRHWRSTGSLLFPIAQAIADIICSVDFSHIKHCEGPTCTLLFHDKTKGHARRWCSMAACGNRAKQAAYRARTGKI